MAAQQEKVTKDSSYRAIPGAWYSDYLDNLAPKKRTAVKFMN